MSLGSQITQLKEFLTLYRDPSKWSKTTEATMFIKLLSIQLTVIVIFWCALSLFSFQNTEN